ncbi:probable short-chain dehydrogenase/reductase [Phialocephala subalpina]|uniref:Probable short-chain dehydrogenase/reductase n=1 Tax=Phialocephala subalpina TaxID=576137 RepID=A0A1L7XRS5_9HELO|nr:probable short-chain dehydrogenase/reductase [Phialocephala subalpina]
MVQKTVLITGSSEGGIGDALAKEFHKNGLRVFATARNLAKVLHLKDMGLEVLKLDVTDDASIKQAVEEVKALTGGTLDFLVNNSGGGYNLPMLDTTVADARKLFDLNVFALVAVTQAFAPLLVASKGTVINIGSVAGITPMPWQGYYNATKAAVALITDNMRIEMAPWGVKFINVITGGVKSRFFENLVAQHLPSNSLYLPAKDEIEPMMNGSLVKKNALDVDVYAKRVVANALKSNPKVHFWAGSEIWTIWLVDTFGWSTIWGMVMSKLVNMPLVSRKIKAAE